MKNLKLNEKFLFYLVLALNVFFVFTFKFYPSLDGPSHLYNANIILHLLKGNESSINSFFTFNSVLVPNLLTHYILALLLFIFPSWLAEKFLIFFYIAGLAISFRLLVSKLNHRNKALSILIFPFIYTFLFHVGFYNHSMSFVLLFFTLFYWLKIENNRNFLQYFFLFLLITLTFFSNALIYFFLGLTLGLFLLVSEVYRKEPFTIDLIRILKKLAFLLLIFLPSLLIFLIFYKSTPFWPSEGNGAKGELLKAFLTVRSLIVYRDSEKIYTSIFFLLFIVIVASTGFTLFRRGFADVKLFILRKNNIILIPALFSLILFFTVPSNMVVGMMSDRYLQIFYMFFILWIASLSIPTRLKQVAIIITLSLHVTLFCIHYVVLKRLEKEATTVYSASAYIEKNSIVLPVYMSDDWILMHFGDYLGVDKPLIVLRNYEASYDWFPIRWNYKKLPQFVLQNKSSVSGLTWEGTKGNPVRQIDYVLLYGETAELNEPKWKDLNEILKSNFKSIFRSKNGFVLLFAKK